MIIRKVLSGGRITIDAPLLKRLGIKAGDYVITRVRNGALEMVPAKVIEK